MRRILDDLTGIAHTLQQGEPLSLRKRVRIAWLQCRFRIVQTKFEPVLLYEFRSVSAYIKIFCTKENMEPLLV